MIPLYPCISFAFAVNNVGMSISHPEYFADCPADVRQYCE